MLLGFSQYFRHFLVIGFIALIVGWSNISIGGTLSNASLAGVISNEKDGGLVLEAKQLPWSQVLDAVAYKVHVPIHYSELPEGLVTVTCKGKSLKPVLECLLDKKADLILRYQAGLAKADSEQVVVEAWVLRGGTHQAVAKQDSPNAANKPDKVEQPSPTKQNDHKALPDRTDELLAQVQSINRDERVAAISALLANGRKGDPDVTAVLVQALTDPDASVRAQAISSLSHREGNAANGYIQQALLDSSEDVRIMAVEGIIDDVALLQQAINDSDESVRSLAQVKLESLTQNINKYVNQDP